MSDRFTDPYGFRPEIDPERGSEPSVEIVIRLCVFCGKEHRIEVPRARYDRWQSRRENIQDVFPEMSADEREVLISGTCSACWEQYMKSDDQGDD